jgi:hypothetical protein
MSNTSKTKILKDFLINLIIEFICRITVRKLLVIAPFLLL